MGYPRCGVPRAVRSGCPELASLRPSVPRCPLSFSAPSSLFSLLTYRVRTCPVGRRFVFLTRSSFPERAFGKGQFVRTASLRAPTAAGCAGAAAPPARGGGGGGTGGGRRGGTPRSAGVARGSGCGPERCSAPKGSDNSHGTGWFALKMAGRKGASLTGKRTSGTKLPTIIG